ncbi:mechanosensitive ion channel domain-containing protein [Haloflavibacter putidus]|uniref:Mechanosensitive ion channel n=1 Tax=Haloflavibacter putidus TaxID=2576776 RepID=A0A508A0U8_9FLAO|nr:mechanosensitive ion channel domain-containing protein [Haloflavibacter putidus]TQD39452.1 mechanosensitive ion channel [Haloflavibacter putidus]
MRNYNLVVAVALFTLFSVCHSTAGTSFYQKQDKDTTQGNLPSKTSVTKDKEDFRPNSIKAYNEAYYQLSRLNKSVGLPPNEFNLQTPQAALEHFVLNARNDNYEDALFALNYNLMPDDLTRKEAATLAEKLYFVINQRVRINWDDLPDRPDGQIDISTTTNQAVAGKPRRSLVFGAIDLEDRDVILRLQRIKYKDYGAIWLISANTVDNIDALYKVYGPRRLDRMMPDWARLKIWKIPVWKFVSTLLLFFLSYFVGKLTAYIFRKIFLNSNKIWIHNIASKLAKPAGLTIGVLFFYLVLNKLISFTGYYASTLYAILIIMVIGSITWFFMRMVDYFISHLAEGRIGDINAEENSEARKLLTYVSVARRILTFVVIIIGVSVVLSQFRSLEKIGISLMASAGVATVILGIAAQSTLGNIIAGIQIAITRPASIGDTVIFDDDWGYVEDIRFTYMVVRTWDLRRLIIPLKSVITNTFENWSMNSAHQIRPIVLYADYKVDVQKIREKFKELLENSENWDQDYPPVLQVVDMTEKAIKIRALCSAKDATTTWDLHCALREDLVKFISELEHGAHLSKERFLIENKTSKNKEN